MGVKVAAGGVAVTIITARVGVITTGVGVGGSVVEVAVAVAVAVDVDVGVSVRACSSMGVVSAGGDEVGVSVGGRVVGDGVAVSDKSPTSVAAGVSVSVGVLSLSPGNARKIAAATVKTITMSVAAPISRRCVVEEFSLPFDMNITRFINF